MGVIPHRLSPVLIFCGIILCGYNFLLEQWSGNAEAEGLITPRPFFYPPKFQQKGVLYGKAYSHTIAFVHVCTYAQLSVAKGFPLAPFILVFQIFSALVLSDSYYIQCSIVIVIT